MPLRPTDASQRTHPLIGRDAELSDIRARLEAARGSRGAVVVVDGDAGMGKTALVRTALAGQPVEVVWVSGDEAELTVDHGIVDQILRSLRLSNHSSLDWAESDPERSAAVLLAAVDALDTSTQCPLVVVIDDAQWADTASLRALSFVARRLEDDPVVFILTVRGAGDTALPDRLWRQVDDRGLRLTVQPLSQDQVAALCEGMLDRSIPTAATARLVEHTAGSPLHLCAVLDEVTVEDLGSAQPLPVPRSFSTLIGARLARCEPRVQDIVAAVSVLGNAATVASAAELAGIDDPRPAIDAAVNAGLLAANDDATPETRIEPAHPLVRAAVLEHLSLTRRADLHLEAARLLPEPGAVHHQMLGTLGTDADLWRRATTVAGEQSAIGAHGTAASVFLESMRVAATGEAESRSLLDGVHQLLLAGLTAEAGALRDAVAACPPTADRGYLQGHMALVLGPRRDCRRFLTDAWDHLTAEAGGDVSVLAGERRMLAAGVASQLATESMIQSNGAEALRWARVADNLDPAHRKTTGTGHALASGHAQCGTLVDGLAELDRRCRRAAGRAPTVVADAHVGRGVVRLWTHDLIGAADDLQRAVAAEAGSFVSREGARSHLADVYYRQGRWDDAVLTAQRAASVLDDSEQGWAAYMSWTTLARILAARGQDGAQECWDRAQAAVTASGTVIGFGYTGLGRIEMEACRRDHDEVARFGEFAASFSGREFVGAWGASYVESLVALDRLDDADAALAALAGQMATPVQATDTARAAICLAAARDDGHEVDRRAEAALALDVADVGPYPRARLELIAGRAWRRRGERRRAAEVLEAAQAGFAALQAAAWFEPVEREIAALGLNPAARSTRVAHDLTPQEQAVARLVAQGLKNREVAVELVISAKTVEHHLGRIYAKLGVRSRTELAHHVLHG